MKSTNIIIGIVVFAIIALGIYLLSKPVEQTTSTTTGTTTSSSSGGLLSLLNPIKNLFSSNKN